MLSYNSLSTSDYHNLRYQVLLATEENGNLKKTAYLDSNNDPTIGMGFNLTDKNVREAVLKGLGSVSRTASAACFFRPLPWACGRFRKGDALDVQWICI